jgi:hypothetical protein
VRGDSLRDLYAKALALLGLTVLAGVGALVDYWPTRSPMPRIEGLQTVPALASVQPVDTSDIAAPAPRRVRRVATPAPVIPSSAPLPISTSADLLTGGTDSFGEAPLPALTAPAVVTDLPMPAVELSDLAAVEAESPRFLAAAATPVVEDDGGGFFAGATGLAKKAGSSILSTGSKAGASIMDGLSFVGRGLKKLKFF